MIFFFFKQKTAYEMRISDWSSDVCSSDLACRGTARQGEANRGKGCFPSQNSNLHRQATALNIRRGHCNNPMARSSDKERPFLLMNVQSCLAKAFSRFPFSIITTLSQNKGSTRSEEHTSELQSLMRISYAVFCLNKK